MIKTERNNEINRKKNGRNRKNNVRNIFKKHKQKE